MNVPLESFAWQCTGSAAPRPRLRARGGASVAAHRIRRRRRSAALRRVAVLDDNRRVKPRNAGARGGGREPHPNDRIPDVRDGLTREERIVLYVLQETQK